MDEAAIVKVLAEAVISEGAKDIYGRVKTYLTDTFNIRAFGYFEGAPSQNSRQLALAEEMVEQKALDDPQVLALLTELVAQMRALHPTGAAANVDISHLKSGGDALVEDIRAEGSASVRVEGLEADGNITIRGITAKS